MASLHPHSRWVSPSTIARLLTGLGIILAAEIAAVCSHLFAIWLLPGLRPDWLLILVSAAMAGLLVGLPGWYVLMQRKA
jgi:hypothetical protein